MACKNHAAMNPPSFSLSRLGVAGNALLLLLSLTAVPAHAEKADSAKPMNIEADALRYDDLKQTSVFTGRVVLTKGTIQIRGARLEVRQDPQGYQHAVVTAAPDKLAFFRQKREGLDEFIEGESRTIEFDGRADTVKFLRDAELRRYRGATLGDEVSGALIVYQNTTDVFTVDGAPSNITGRGAPTAASGRANGRVRAVLIPQSTERAGSPAAASAPATPTGPTLRPSSRLGGAAEGGN